MVLFSKVVENIAAGGRYGKRLEKIELLAALLEQLKPEEVEIAVAYLSGSTRQGRSGIGYAALRGAAALPAESATLEIREVDRMLGLFAAVQGRGSER